VACLLSSHSTEQEQCHEVGECHERIHAVGNIPDDIEADDTSKEQEDDEDDAVEAVGNALLDIVDGTLAIVAPTEYGAEGEGEDTKGEQTHQDAHHPCGYAKGFVGQPQRTELSIKKKSLIVSMLAVFFSSQLRVHSSELFFQCLDVLPKLAIEGVARQCDAVAQYDDLHAGPCDSHVHAPQVTKETNLSLIVGAHQ